MSKIVINKARLSFPSLFQKAKFNNVEGKYEATFLIPKSDKETKEKIDKLIEQVQKDGNVKVPKDKVCIKDGDDFEYDGYAGHWVFKGSSKKKPKTVDRNKDELTEEDDKLYGGCYVRAVVDVWAQNNQYGKRVNGNLYAVQFLEHGEPFGDSGVDVDEYFDDLDDLDDVI